VTFAATSRFTVTTDVVAKGSRELDLASFGQLEDRCPGEHVHRPDPESGIDNVRDPSIAIREAVGATAEHLTVFRHENRAAEPARSLRLTQHTCGSAASTVRAGIGSVWTCRSGAGRAGRGVLSIVTAAVSLDDASKPILRRRASGQAPDPIELAGVELLHKTNNERQDTGSIRGSSVPSHQSSKTDQQIALRRA
jgi:hypothetical protein